MSEELKQTKAADSIEKARQDLNVRFRDLTLPEISLLIDQEFIASGKIRLIPDRNKNIVVVAEGATSLAKAQTLRLYSYALKLQKLSAANAAGAPKRIKPPTKAVEKAAAEPETAVLPADPSDASVLYQLVLMPMLGAGDTPEVIERLALFEQAITEAGDDREEVELVIAQLFRQGLITRREVRVEDDGVIQSEYIVLTPEVQAWHDKVVSANKSMAGFINEDDGFPMLDADLPTKTKGNKWLRLRPGFKRHR